MANLTIKELYQNAKEYAEKEVTLEGWAKTVRDSKTFGFIELNDGSFFKNVQIVFNDKLSNFAEVAKLTISSTIKVVGTVVITENAKQPFEIQANSIEIESLCPTNYPLQKKRHSFEYLRTIAHLRPRTNTFNAVFRIRSVAAFAIHQYFQERGYVYVHTPIITCADCEGSAEMFKLTTLNLDEDLPKKDGKVDFSQDLFGKKAYITGSGQLHGETFASAFGRIYTFGPTLRSENSNTSYIKRVIGLPGDYVEIKDGAVYINNEKLEENYLQEGIVTDMYQGNRAGNVNCFTVPENYVFCLGDNRTGSNDCRSFGCIPLEKIEGKVEFRFWPLSKFGGV